MTAVLICDGRVSVADPAQVLALIDREAPSGLGVATVGAGLPQRIDAHLAKAGHGPMRGPKSSDGLSRTGRRLLEGEPPSHDRCTKTVACRAGGCRCFRVLRHRSKCACPHTGRRSIL